MMKGTHSTPHPVWVGRCLYRGCPWLLTPSAFSSRPSDPALPAWLSIPGGSLWIVPDTSVHGAGGAWKSGTTGCGSGCLSGEGGLPGRVAGAGSCQDGHPPTPRPQLRGGSNQIQDWSCAAVAWLSPTLDSAWTMWGLFQGSEASWSEVVPSLTGKEDSGRQQCLSVPVIAGGFYEPVTGLSPATSRPFCPSLGTYSWGRAVLGVGAGLWRLQRWPGSASAGACPCCLPAGWGRWLFWTERP